MTYHYQQLQITLMAICKPQPLSITNTGQILNEILTNILCSFLLLEWFQTNKAYLHDEY